MPNIYSPQQTYYDQITGASQPDALNKTYDTAGGNLGPVNIGVPTATHEFQTTGQASGPSPAAAPQSAPTTQSAQAPASPFSPGSFVNTSATQGGSIYSNLFSPVNQQVQQGQQALGAAKSQFQEQAGPSRTFESVGGAQTLNNVFTPGGNNPTAVEAARSLVGAKYEGPQGLSQEATGNLAKQGAQLQGQASTFRQPGGAEELLRRQRHGLTAGERQFEASRIENTQGYKDQARAAQNAVGQLASNAANEEQQAAAFAKQRQAEEANIAEQSKGLLTGKRGEVETQLQQEVDQEAAKEKALRQLYEGYQASGDVNALTPAIGQENAGLFNNEFVAKSQEASAAKAAIVGKPEYASIKDVPTMEITLNSHGREQLRVPKEWWDANTKGMSKKEKASLKELAKQRQLELERGGFTPGSAAAKNQKSVRQEAARTPGQYSGYDPLYFGGDMGAFAPQDTRSYVNYEQGTDLNRASVADQGQRDTYNLVNDLLGQADRLEQTDPYQASVIRNEAQRYYDEQQHELQMRQEGLAKDVKRETNQVVGARADKRASGRVIGKVVKGIGTFGGSETGAPGAELLPQFEGERRKAKLKKQTGKTIS